MTYGLLIIWLPPRYAIGNFSIGFTCYCHPNCQGAFQFSSIGITADKFTSTSDRFWVQVNILTSSVVSLALWRSSPMRLLVILVIINNLGMVV